jgi:hypothetical protein
METKHYIVTNLQQYSDDKPAVEKFEKYLYVIESVFPYIEKTFGKKGTNKKITIILDNSESGGKCDKNNIVTFGINNHNIKESQKNLWGCLFHETHHAFLNSITVNRDGKILNGGHKAEIFNYAFMAATYLKLKEENKIDTKDYERFLDKLEKELKETNKQNRHPSSKYYILEVNLQDNAMIIYRKYLDSFLTDINGFSRFISRISSSKILFTKVENFEKDLAILKK